MTEKRRVGKPEIVSVGQILDALKKNDYRMSITASAFGVCRQSVFTRLQRENLWDSIRRKKLESELKILKKRK